MRICPVCPVMEIIVPVDVTDVEQEAAQALWDLQDQPVPEAVREFRGPRRVSWLNEGFGYGWLKIACFLSTASMSRTLICIV